MKLYFEELETVEELGYIGDFCGAAAPYIGAGIAILAIIYT